MSHMVIFRSTEGKSGYHQTEELDEAIRFVERLRNAEGVEQAKIFRLEEVTFEFRPYYRVEVGAATAGPSSPPTPVPPVPPIAEGEPVEVDGEASDVLDDDLVASNGKRGLFGR